MDVHQDIFTLHIGHMWDAHANHRKRGKFSLVQFIRSQLESLAKTRRYIMPRFIIIDYR